MLYSFIDKIIETKSVGTIKDCNDPPQCKVAIFNFLCYFNTLFSSFLFLFLLCICDTFQFKNRERYQPPLEISSCILYRFYQMKRIFFLVTKWKGLWFCFNLSVYLFNNFQFQSIYFLCPYWWGNSQKKLRLPSFFTLN